MDLALVVEAVRLVEEGVAGVDDVDRAMELGRDHPTGPLALADELGLDRVLAALEDLANRLDGRFDPPGLLREKVDAGNLGVRTGEGFYVWDGGDRVEPADPDSEVRARSDGPIGSDDAIDSDGPMGSDGRSGRDARDGRNERGGRDERRGPGDG